MKYRYTTSGETRIWYRDISCDDARARGYTKDLRKDGATTLLPVMMTMMV